MRYLIFFFLLPALLAVNDAGVTIPARQTFILGEYMNEAYNAKLINKGPQTVTVSLVSKVDGVVQQTLDLASGTSDRLQVEPAYEVHLTNDSDQPAEVQVRMSKRVSGMRYIGQDMPTEASADAQETVRQDTRVFVPKKDAGSAKEKVVVTIPVGQQLVIGEGTSASYTAELRVTRQVKISIRDKETGAQTQGFGLRGKERVHVRRHENIYVVNESGAPVKVTVEMTKSVAGERLEAATEPTSIN